jgi:acetyltransferase-like isoleucine patch superfamily enzyme
MTANELGGLYRHEELVDMLGAVGENVAVNRSVLFYSPRNVFLGDNVRIDGFCILSAGLGGIVLDEHVHLSAYCFLVGPAGRIHLQGFSGLASRCTLYTATDDFREGYLTGPTIPEKYRKVRGGDVILGRHALIGAGSIVLPGVTIGEGAAVGALSLVRKDVPALAIVAGNPLRTLGQRNGDRLRQLENELVAEKRAARKG